MTGKLFSLFPRKTKKGKVYYCQFKQPSGKFSTAKSTGCTNKHSAEKWAIEKIQEGKPYLSNKALDFKTFSEDFFNFNNAWATDKKARGMRISQRHCRERTFLLKNHLIPFFGDYQLTDINRGLIKEFRNSLYNKGYSGAFTNKNLQALKSILDSAEELEIISGIPKIDRAAVNSKPKGILTLEETKILFAHTWTTKETFRHPIKINYKSKIGNRLAATTGARLSEIQALTFKDIHLEESYISINRSWDVTTRTLNATTKTGKTRNIFIPKIVNHELSALMETHPLPCPDAFVFFSETIPEQPVNQRCFLEGLYKALDEIGISEQERQERNITFHSWRSFMNSLMINSKIPLQKVQQITGHLSGSMSELYYRIDDMQDVKAIQESIFNTALNDETIIN